MKAQYKTAISDARWIAYDIPGNVGWIVYLACVFRGLREKRDGYSIAAALPGVLMLIGVGELISERVAGLDRVLSSKRLFRGFGALTAGGLLGSRWRSPGLRETKNGRQRCWQVPRYARSSQGCCSQDTGNNKVNIKDHYHRWGRCSLPVFLCWVSTRKWGWLILLLLMILLR